MALNDASHAKNCHGDRSSSAKWIKFAAGTAMIASIFSSTTTYSQSNKCAGNHDKKDFLELTDTKTDGIEHQKISSMEFSTIFTLYGEEKGLEIIREHFVQEINIIREKKGLNPLQNSVTLDNATQGHANFLDKNPNIYDFTGKDRSKSVHMEYDALGLDILNTPAQRANQAGYSFSIISENISTTGFFRPLIKGTITEVVQEWLREEGHAKNIFSLTRDIGVGYADGIVVIAFAK